MSDRRVDPSCTSNCGWRGSGDGAADETLSPQALCRTSPMSPRLVRTWSGRMTKLAEDIRTRMERAEDWERIPTSIPGIFMVHMPDKELRVMLMFNPTDDAGNPTKRKGFYFGDRATVEAARQARTDVLMLSWRPCRTRTA